MKVAVAHIRLRTIVLGCQWEAPALFHSDSVSVMSGIVSNESLWNLTLESGRARGGINLESDCTSGASIT